MTLVERLKARDPDLLNLRKATRAVIVCVPLFAILDQGFHLGTLATYSFFASFVGLVFADFGGKPWPRIAAYVAMIVIGDLVIILGSVLSGTVFGAAIAMFLVMFAVTFATVFGGYAPAFIAPVALAYSLTVLEPLSAAPIELRVLGWSIGGAAALIAALLLWPVDRRLALRQTLAAVCDGLGEALESIGDRAAAEAAFKRVADLLAVARAKASAPFRPCSPLSRDIGLLHLAEHLEQANDIARQLLETGPPSPDDAALVATCAAAFREAGAALQGSADPMAARDAVALLQAALQSDRQETSLSAIDAAGGSDDDGASRALAVMRRSTPVFALSHVAMWVDAAAAVSLGVRDEIAVPNAAVDPEKVSDRPVDLLGRTWRIIARGFARDGVIFRNSIRAGAAMTLAVVLAKLLPVEHGFWITLGALLVLRSSAAATSATALQAVGGTLAGFIVATALLTFLHESATALWIILPLTIFLAGYTPGAVGFLVGQASFTTALVVLFTLIAPAGISTAVERLETVSLGAVSAAVIGLMLWPRGARAALAAALGRVYRAAASGLRAVVTGSAEHCRQRVAEMQTVRRQADETFGVALTERGLHLEPQVWIALFQPPNLAHSMVSGLLPTPAPSHGGAYAAALSATIAYRDRVADALQQVADTLEPAGAPSPAEPAAAPAPDPTPILMAAFDAARADGPDAVGAVRELVDWNWWLTYMEKEIAATQADVDLVATVSKPQAWLRWSLPGRPASPRRG